ncbi:unnamed protein product [Schistosoma turkestanicum]|nr:unnamed protein product [Schistosoma turkestanicum]
MSVAAMMPPSPRSPIWMINSESTANFGVRSFCSSSGELKTLLLSNLKLETVDKDHVNNLSIPMNMFSSIKDHNASSNIIEESISYEEKPIDHVNNEDNLNNLIVKNNFQQELRKLDNPTRKTIIYLFKRIALIHLKIKFIENSINDGKFIQRLLFDKQLTVELLNSQKTSHVWEINIHPMLSKFLILLFKSDSHYVTTPMLGTSRYSLKTVSDPNEIMSNFNLLISNFYEQINRIVITQNQYHSLNTRLNQLTEEYAKLNLEINKLKALVGSQVSQTKNTPNYMVTDGMITSAELIGINTTENDYDDSANHINYDRNSQVSEDSSLPVSTEIEVIIGKIKIHPNQLSCIRKQCTEAKQEKAKQLNPTKGKELKIKKFLRNNTSMQYEEDEKEDNEEFSNTSQRYLLQKKITLNHKSENITFMNRKHKQNEIHYSTLCQKQIKPVFKQPAILYRMKPLYFRSSMESLKILELFSLTFPSYLQNEIINSPVNLKPNILRYILQQSGILLLLTSENHLKYVNKHLLGTDTYLCMKEIITQKLLNDSSLKLCTLTGFKYMDSKEQLDDITTNDVSSSSDSFLSSDLQLVLHDENLETTSYEYIEEFLNDNIDFNVNITCTNDTGVGFGTTDIDNFLCYHQSTEYNVHLFSTIDILLVCFCVVSLLVSFWHFNVTWQLVLVFICACWYFVYE